MKGRPGLLNGPISLILVLVTASCETTSPETPQDLPSEGTPDMASPEVNEDQGQGDQGATMETGTDLSSPEVPEDSMTGETLPPDLPADPGGVGDLPGDAGPRPPDPAVRLREAGWLSGDLHQHTTYSDGDDPVAVTIRIAESFQDPTFLAFHPEYEGNPIDFMAVTDHRTIDQNRDPDFHSDRLILIPGEEFGGPGHAGIWGLSSLISHDPDGDGATLEDYRQGVTEAHRQGALFSMNHPVLPSHLFGWDLRDHDAMEVWNTRWGLQGRPTTLEDLASWEQANGPASPAIRRAIQVQDEGASGQFLRLYEAQLSLGIHLALVGGSDRHVFFPMGFPSTWVRAPTRDMAGVLEGIRARHTFVSRSPVSATLEMSVTLGNASFEMGDAIPIPPEGAEVVLSIRVTRAPGARLRLIRGGPHFLEAEEDWPLGEVAFEAPVEKDDASFQVTLMVGPGDWAYPVVHEPVIPEGTPPELAEQARRIAEVASSYSESNYAPLIEALLEYLDLNVVLAPEACDPGTWVALHAQCMPADDHGLATFFLPDWIDRIFNGLTENGEPSPWAMGAVGSAVRFVAPEERFQSNRRAIGP